MTSLAWLAIPVVAVILAIAYVSWVSRTRRPADIEDTVAGYARFQAALGEATRRSGPPPGTS